MRSYSATNMYFGRWLLYMLLGLVQGLIVCVGDVFLPGVQCRHPFALVLTGLVCSFVYVNIIYALSLTFKHIGKALCVIFVILQIPGSSGTYPIEMTPAFSRKYTRFFHSLMELLLCVKQLQACMEVFISTTF